MRAPPSHLRFQRHHTDIRPERRINRERLRLSSNLSAAQGQTSETPCWTPFIRKAQAYWLSDGAIVQRMSTSGELSAMWPGRDELVSPVPLRPLFARRSLDEWLASWDTQN